MRDSKCSSLLYIMSRNPITSIKTKKIAEKESLDEAVDGQVGKQRH